MLWWPACRRCWAPRGGWSRCCCSARYSPPFLDYIETAVGHDLPDHACSTCCAAPRTGCRTSTRRWRAGNDLLTTGYVALNGAVLLAARRRRPRPAGQPAPPVPGPRPAARAGRWCRSGTRAPSHGLVRRRRAQALSTGRWRRCATCTSSTRCSGCRWSSGSPTCSARCGGAGVPGAPGQRAWRRRLAGRRPRRPRRRAGAGVVAVAGVGQPGARRAARPRPTTSTPSPATGSEAVSWLGRAGAPDDTDGPAGARARASRTYLWGTPRTSRCRRYGASRLGGAQRGAAGAARQHPDARRDRGSGSPPVGRRPGSPATCAAPASAAWWCATTCAPPTTYRSRCWCTRRSTARPGLRQGRRLRPRRRRDRPGAASRTRAAARWSSTAAGRPPTRRSRSTRSSGATDAAGVEPAPPRRRRGARGPARPARRRPARRRAGRAGRRRRRAGAEARQRLLLLPTGCGDARRPSRASTTAAPPPWRPTTTDVAGPRRATTSLRRRARWETTAQILGARSVDASGSRAYADTVGPVLPETLPYAAFDGRPETAWESGLAAPRRRTRGSRSTLERPAEVGHGHGRRGRDRPDDDPQRSWSRPRPGRRGPGRCPGRRAGRGRPLPAGATSWLRVEHARGRRPSASSSIAEVRVDGLDVDRTLVLPEVPAGVGCARPRAAVVRARRRDACVEVEDDVRCAAGRERPDEERRGHRPDRAARRPARTTTSRSTVRPVAGDALTGLIQRDQLVNVTRLVDRPSTTPAPRRWRRSTAPGHDLGRRRRRRRPRP